MKIRSAKAKGKVLEKLVRDTILLNYPKLDFDDVRITVGCETGADVKLTKKAVLQFPYSVECKNRETFSTLYKHYEQAAGHNTLEPLLVLKMNRKVPLVVVSMEHFFKLLGKNNKNE